MIAQVLEDKRNSNYDVIEIYVELKRGEFQKIPGENLLKAAYYCVCFQTCGYFQASHP